MKKLPPGRPPEPRRIEVTSADVREDGAWQPMRLRPEGFQQGAAQTLGARIHDQVIRDIWEAEAAARIDRVIEALERRETREYGRPESR